MSVQFNNKQELKDWLSERLETKGRASLRTSITNSVYIKTHINNYMDIFKDVSMTYTQKVHHIVKDLNYIPLCKTCGIKHPNFNNNKWGYLEISTTSCYFCSTGVEINVTFKTFSILQTVSKVKFSCPFTHLLTC